MRVELVWRLVGENMGNLSDRTVKAAKQGMHGDGNGLWLVVSKTGARAWAYRYTLKGAAHTMGLGGYPMISLAEARDEASKNRKLARGGIDPLARRRADEEAKLRAAKPTPTFGDIAK